MTLLITGGAGFIGSRLIERLGSGTDYVIVDSLHEQVHGSKAHPPENSSDRNFIRGDITDAAMWDELLGRMTPSTVVHLAAETGTGQSLHEAARHANVNVNGTAIMLDAFSRNKKIPSGIILTSSRAVYGEGLWEEGESKDTFYGEPRTASRLESREWWPLGPAGQTGTALPHRAGLTEPRPINIYAATKLAQENILTAWSASMGSSLSILRLQNVYGRGQSLRNPYTGVLTAFARRILEGDEVNVYEGGGIVRDFVHVSDVAQALMASIERPAGPSKRRLVDIGSGVPGSLEHFASVLAGFVDGARVSTSSDYRLGDVRSAWADNSQAAVELGYAPKVAFEEGAAELLAWAKQEMDRGH